MGKGILGVCFLEWVREKIRDFPGFREVFLGGRDLHQGSGHWWGLLITGFLLRGSRAGCGGDFRLIWEGQRNT